MGTSGTDRDAVAGLVSIARIDAAGWGVFFIGVGVAILIRNWTRRNRLS
jgi:hypothetical protein